jgi:hypothetical protein
MSKEDKIEELPTFDECAENVAKDKHNCLQLFIFNWEPAGNKNECSFREDLLALVKELQESEPEPTEFRNECEEIREIYLQEPFKTSEAGHWLVKRLANQLSKGCEIIDRLTAENKALYDEILQLKKVIKLARDEIGYEGCWESVVQDKIKQELQIMAKDKEIKRLKDADLEKHLKKY